MSDHKLYMGDIDDGCVDWHLTCEHPADDPQWHQWTEASPAGMVGTIRFQEEECWLMTWWDALGDELLGHFEPPYSWPLHVVPSDDWDEDGGTIEQAP